jgi:Tfp pilus assembly protein PilO
VRGLSARERLLLAVVLSAALATLFYVFVWTPKTAERDGLATKLQTQQEELRRLQDLAAKKDELEREYSARLERVLLVEARLPAEREIPDLLRQLQDTAVQLGVKLTLMRPGPTQAPAAPAAPPAAPPAGQQPPRGQAAAPPPAPAPRYQLFRVDMGFEGTYEKLIAYLSRLEDFPRFIVLTQVAMIPGELPRLRATLSTNTFVLPRESQPKP